MKQLRDMMIAAGVVAAVLAVILLTEYLERNRIPDDKTVVILEPPHDWHPEWFEPHEEVKP